MDAEFGMRDYPLSLKAGRWVRQDVDGDYFLIVEATGTVFLRFDDGDLIQRRVAQGMPVRFYKKVAIMSAADQDVIIALGYTGGGLVPLDGRATLAGDVNVTVNVPSQRVSPLDVLVPAGAKLQVLAIDADRLMARIQLSELAPDYVRVGDSAVDATRGTKIWPEDIALEEGPAAVYVFNPNAVDIVVHLGTERAP